MLNRRTAFRVTTARQAVLVSAVLLASACGGDSGPARIEAEGAWSGGVNDNTGAQIATISMTLTETNGAVTGNGNLSNAGTAVAITITGTYSPPSLSIAVASPGFNTMNLTATVAEAQMSGTINGSGFINSPVTLARQ